MPPLEIQVLLPFSRTCALPSGSAVIFNAATSEPASSSEMREGSDALAFSDIRQIALFQFRRAVERDRAGAEPLHGEGEIGKAVVIAQNFARQTQRADIELRM